MSSCKMAVNFVTRFSKNNEILNFMKIHPEGAELLQADGLTDGHSDMTKLIFAFLQFCEGT